MGKKVLVRTNVFICAVIILGFLLTSVVSYRANNGIFRKDIERISTLTSNGIYHQIDSIFTKPVNISLTMANDSLLKNFLTEEETKGEEDAFEEAMRDYLSTYKEKYEYDSVFLVSAKSNRYYHFEQGVDRILTEDDPENEWYYSFLKDSKEYVLNIDNDEVQSANNEINIFINCKIFSPAGEVMGVVGVGFGVKTMQEMFQSYEDNSQICAYLVDKNGTIEISTNKTGYEKTSLFDEEAYGAYRQDILSGGEEIQSFWYSQENQSGFLMARYVPNLEWYLIIDNDTSALESSLNRQFFIGVLVIIMVIGLVLIIITNIIRKYNTKIVSLTVEKEKSYRTVFQTETEKLYESIYELDITHNRAVNEVTESYFESLGVPGKLPYDKVLKVIAEKQIKEEYREGYIQTFSTENVLKAYEEGRDSLQYDFLITTDGGVTYYWMRITARIFYWEEDHSVRMLAYRQNVDREKRRELRMREKMQKDPLSGLYNKAAAQEQARQQLADNPGQCYGFFILDIDDFKAVNDTWGHAAGDQVLSDFAEKLRRQFRKEDIVGRIGGDEFMVFMAAPSKEWTETKAESLARALQYEFSLGEKSCRVSASIGVAVSPEGGEDYETLYQNADNALYQTKGRGKNNYTVYTPVK